MPNPTSLHAAKIRATRAEFHRVYDLQNLPPRDITLDYDGTIWVRYAWHGLGRFGWEPWKRLT